MKPSKDRAKHYAPAELDTSGRSTASILPGQLLSPPPNISEYVSLLHRVGQPSDDGIALDGGGAGAPEQRMGERDFVRCEAKQPCSTYQLPTLNAEKCAAF